MTRLLKFTGTSQLPGVATPQVVADTAVGAQIKDLGDTVETSLQDVSKLVETGAAILKKNRQAKVKEEKEANANKQASLAEDRVQKRIKFDAAQKAVQVVQGVRTRARAAKDQPRVPASGLSEEMLRFMADTSRKMSAGMPDDQKAVFNKELDRRQDDLLYDVAAVEEAADRDHFLQGLAASRDQAVEDVEAIPQRIDRAFAHFKDLVDQVPLPGRVRDEVELEAAQALTETWVARQPLEVQIEGLSAEPGAASAHGDSAASGSKQAVAGDGGLSAHEFAARAGVLPPESRNRLLEQALQKKAADSIAEAERIAARIDAADGQFRSAEIDENPKLGPEAKLQLYDHYRRDLQTHADSLVAAGWAASNGRADPLKQEDRDRADLAFAYLEKTGSDPAALALGIVQQKGVLPAAYARRLATALTSPREAEIAQALTTVSALARSGGRAMLGLEEEQPLRSFHTKQEVLKRRFGLTPDEIAKRFAQGNQPKLRKERQVAFRDFHAQRTSGRSAENRVIARFGTRSASLDNSSKEKPAGRKSKTAAGASQAPFKL